MRHLLGPVMVVVALVAVGCTFEAPGQALPATGDSTPTSRSPSTSRSGSAGVPPISSPELDLASFESKVCELLTTTQLARFAIRAGGKAEDSVAGPSCTWKPPDTSAGARVDLTILSKAKDGWDGVYERRGNFPFFEETGEINGYPAVHVDATTIGVHNGTCATTVGVSRSLVFEAGVFVNGLDSPEYKKPCSVSDKVASLVIDTLKGGR